MVPKDAVTIEHIQPPGTVTTLTFFVATYSSTIRCLMRLGGRGGNGVSRAVMTEKSSRKDSPAVKWLKGSSCSTTDFAARIS